MVRLVLLYCYNVKLDTPSCYGLPMSTMRRKIATSSEWQQIHTSQPYSGSCSSGNFSGRSCINKGAVCTRDASTRDASTRDASTRDASINTENCHICRMVAIVRPNSIVWAGEKACFTPRAANVIQPDCTRAGPKPTEESDILMIIQFTYTVLYWGLIYICIVYHQAIHHHSLLDCIHPSNPKPHSPTQAGSGKE